MDINNVILGVQKINFQKEKLFCKVREKTLVCSIGNRTFTTDLTEESKVV